MPIMMRVFTPVVVTDPGAGPSPAPASPPLPVATIKQLHDELSAVGLPVVETDVGAVAQFGPAASTQSISGTL